MPERTGTWLASSRGLGLGLYIAQQIARAHGGRVEVASSENEGTRFTVHLPLERHEIAHSAVG